MTEKIRLVQRLNFILEACTGQSVLHLGCANYPYTEDAIKNDMLLHFELEKISREIYAIDSDQAGIDILNSHGSENIFRADLEKLDELDLDKTFDVIVAGEIIEHLNNPGLFLEGIKRFMNPDTRLLITTINAYSGMRFLWYGIRGKGGKVEFVHPDHVAYYSYSTLRVLVERHHLQVEEFLFYDLGTEHRPHNRWFLNIFNDIFVKLAPQWSEGVIAVCKLPL